MVLHNPPKEIEGMPSHEHYATEGHQKFYRPKKTEESMKQLGAKHKEHEDNYWSGRDHS